MPRPDPITPMYFSTLEIENIKCIGRRQILDLKNESGAIAPWTLILGDNGVGKTTLLKCLAWMKPVEAPGGPQLSLKPFMDDLDESQFESYIRVGSDVGATIMATFANGTPIGERPRLGDTVTIGMQLIREHGELNIVHAMPAFVSEFNTPRIFAYGASRHMGVNNLDEVELQNPISNLFGDRGDLYDAETVLVTLDHVAKTSSTEGVGKSLLTKLKRLLTDLLPDIEKPENIIVKNKLEKPSGSQVELITPYGTVDMAEISLGYKTMLAWALDLALRMFWADVEAENPLDQPAIVLIDEADLHLHPRWQRDVKDYLLKHFPRTQFICTAHSPFIAQASAGDNLAVIRREDGSTEVEIINDPSVVKGWRVGQFATSELFGLSSERSPDIEKKVARRRHLLGKSNLNQEEETELRQLDADLSVLPVGEEIKNQELIDTLRAFTETIKSGNKRL